ncbi:ATP-dependent DNA helicase [Marinihelvus fidelis]|uniref:ATP-dependent DNA helicase n=1 Tax=Marinihelvus fidelis TaxID=2613842 RepID=A0A5N0TAT9_9GAMM|nr:ATP-binding protein [Marinihelvus fidelis]KAA9131544.1 ATP-dependent DNA helicase [Marinihelvus fidelis]
MDLKASVEGQTHDIKSIRLVSGKSADWKELACTCVCFANSRGGQILLGIEDGESSPPEGQRISDALLERISKRVGELTIHVNAFPEKVCCENGAEYVRLNISRSQNVASTTDGRFFIRVSDQCMPITGDNVLRLAEERPGWAWELVDSQLGKKHIDPLVLKRLVTSFRHSERVRPSVKEKSDAELLEHYSLVIGRNLTNLGALLVGSTNTRRSLGVAPIVQALKFDDAGNKVNKWAWDDHTQSPIELVEAIWGAIPDFKESYEVSEGLYRKSVPAYDEKVVRELLINALVHRPYTQKGDIYINLRPGSLEIVNPGTLPLGVTTRNILNASRRRNEELARVFHDLELMEREGSGYDLVYDLLLSRGRPIPELKVGQDRVSVTIRRLVPNPGVMRLMQDADARHQLTQRERITLGVLAQSDGLIAGELVERLETDQGSLSSWLGRLLELELVETRGRTKGTRYLVSPELLRDSGMTGATSLKHIEPHRLAALVREDVGRYPDSRIGEIHERIGSEIPRSQLRKCLKNLVDAGDLVMIGERAGSRYRAGDT